MNTEARRRALNWVVLVLVVIITVAVVIIPAVLIQPFSSQSHAGLAVSFQLRRWSPVITVILGIISLFLTWKLWQGGRWWSRILSLLLLGPVLLAVWFARQNHFEWMFHPLPNASYATAGEAKNLQESDMVMSVSLSGDAVAYPVREMAYHHVVNDVVGGRPITATY